MWAGRRTAEFWAAYRREQTGQLQSIALIKTGASENINYLLKEKLKKRFGECNSPHQPLQCCTQVDQWQTALWKKSLCPQSLWTQPRGRESAVIGSFLFRRRWRREKGEDGLCSQLWVSPGFVWHKRLLLSHIYKHRVRSVHFNNWKMIKKKVEKSDFLPKALPKFSVGQNLILNIIKLLEMSTSFFSSNIW